LSVPFATAAPAAAASPPAPARASIRAAEPVPSVELAVTAMKFLADAKLRPEVRAWAAWALGMMQAPPSGTKLNYALVAYHAGLTAAELGEAIAAADQHQAAYLTGLLVYQIYNALHGEPGVRGAGLVNQAGLGTSQTDVAAIDTLVGQVAAAGIEVSRAAGTQSAQRRGALRTKVGALRTLLAKSAPKDLEFVPGGPSFPATVAQVAEGP